MPEYVWIVYAVHDGIRTAIHAFRDESKARRWVASRANAAEVLACVLTLEPLAVH